MVSRIELRTEVKHKSSPDYRLPTTTTTTTTTISSSSKRMRYLIEGQY